MSAEWLRIRSTETKSSNAFSATDFPSIQSPNIRFKDDIDSGIKYIEFGKKEIIPDTVQFLDIPKADDVYLELIGFEPPFSKYESTFYKITDYNAFVEYGDLNWKYYGYSSKYVLQTIAQLSHESKEVIRKMEERLMKKVQEIIIPDVNEEENEMNYNNIPARVTNNMKIHEHD